MEEGTAEEQTAEAGPHGYVQGGGEVEHFTEGLAAREPQRAVVVDGEHRAEAQHQGGEVHEERHGVEGDIGAQVQGDPRGRRPDGAHRQRCRGGPTP